MKNIMGYPILTISLPVGHLNTQRKHEFLANQKDKLDNEFNRNKFQYHILLFENYLDAPIIEIHNNPEDSKDTIELFRQRIQTIIDASKTNDNLMTIDEFNKTKKKNFFQKLFNL